VSRLRVAVYLIVVTTALVVPIGTLVGVVAGYYGGAVDSLLMRYVDVQSTVPAVVAYVVLIVVVGKSLFLLLLVFGLFSWGSVARVVRAATRQRRSAAYVLAGRSVGGSDRYLLRRHLLPNVSHAVVTALAGQVPLLLITEAAVAYLGLGSVDAVSWGSLVANGIETGVFSNWWVAGLPTAALAGTVLCLRLLGDALRDVLDPRGE
jgi:peptide/nickel transport system permease protein